MLAILTRKKKQKKNFVLPHFKTHKKPFPSLNIPHLFVVSLSQGMPPNLCLILFFFVNLSALAFSPVSAVGFNWGTAASHPLPPLKVVNLLNSNNITKIKLLDPNPLVLQALSGSNVQVSIGIPNSMLKLLNSSRKAAESWVHDNVTRYFSGGAAGVRIEYGS